MTDRSGFLRPKLYCSGWLEHKSSKAGGKYSKLWVLLEGNILYIFKTDKPSEDTQIGNLTLTQHTEFTNKQGGNASKGYKFELRTKDKINTFKAKKLTEREQWRGYIIGMAKGQIPPNLDLLEQDLKRIKDDVAEYHDVHRNQEVIGRGSMRSSGSVTSRTTVTQREQFYPKKEQADSGVVSLLESGSVSHSSMSSDSKTLDDGGPTQVHMFYNDRNRNQVPPSWFIPHCSRETAEKILERALSMNLGNTLMRESTSYLVNGSYVISKIFKRSNGSICYDHYEVIRTVGGYKVNVENPHQPMKCLQDVMDYFVSTSESGTQPIITNDLKTLGHDEPGYASQIFNRRQTTGEPWVWPPGSNNVAEPEPDYDDSGTENAPLPSNIDNTPLPSNTSNHVDGSHTISPGILRRDTRTPSSSTGRKSVGWNSVVNTPPPIPQHHTYAPGSKQTRPVAPSVDEFKQRQRETDELNDLDQMICSFERSSTYYNTSAGIKINGRARSESQPYIPSTYSEHSTPPPQPHTFTHSYVNQEGEKDDVAVLPVAPPPPRVPIVPSQSPSTSSKLSPNSSISSSSRFATQKTSAPLNHSQSTSESSSMRTPISQIGKSPSEGQLKTNVLSPNSPKAFPVWNDSAYKTNSVNTYVPNVSNANKATNGPRGSNVNEGVDENNPGGVATLRERFNQMSSGPSPAANKAPGKSAFVRQSTDPTVGQPADANTSTGLTMSPPPTAPKPTAGNRLTQRRQTEPAVSFSKTQFEGLSEDFKKKLGALIGPGPVNPQGGGAGRGGIKSPTSPRNSRWARESTEEPLYQELPEIEPDSVTYVNARFNENNIEDT